MKKQKKWVLALLSVALLAQLGACGVASAQPEEPEQTLPSLPESSYDTDCFSEQDGFYTYDDGDVRASLGVDVSTHQGEIDWQAVKDAGIDFAMIRLGYRGSSEGGLYLDDYFLRNMDGATAAGLKIGVYFFSQALSAQEAEEEAAFTRLWLEGYSLSMPVIFDWEHQGAGSRTDDADGAVMTAAAEAFCDAIAAAGFTPGVYFNQEVGYRQFDLPALKNYDFWLAEYAAVPTFAYQFHLWQYTNAGTVSGIDGTVDLNLYFTQ